MRPDDHSGSSWCSHTPWLLQDHISMRRWEGQGEAGMDKVFGAWVCVCIWQDKAERGEQWQERQFEQCLRPDIPSSHGHPRQWDTVRLRRWPGISQASKQLAACFAFSGASEQSSTIRQEVCSWCLVFPVLCLLQQTNLHDLFKKLAPMQFWLVSVYACTSFRIDHIFLSLPLYCWNQAWIKAA